MKQVTAIVRPEKLEILKEAFFAAQVSGMTISQVQGCGNQKGWTEYYRGSEIMLNMVSKVRFDIVVSEAEVQPLVDLIIKHAQTGEVGDGKIFISSIDNVIRVRTGEEGNAALAH